MRVTIPVQESTYLSVLEAQAEAWTTPPDNPDAGGVPERWEYLLRLLAFLAGDREAWED